MKSYVSTDVTETNPYPNIISKFLSEHIHILTPSNYYTKWLPKYISEIKEKQTKSLPEDFILFNLILHNCIYCMCVVCWSWGKYGSKVVGRSFSDWWLYVTAVLRE